MPARSIEIQNCFSLLFGFSQIGIRFALYIKTCTYLFVHKLFNCIHIYITFDRICCQLKYLLVLRSQPWR